MVDNRIRNIGRNEEIIMDNIEMPFTSLDEQINRLKEAVDKCFLPSIYVHTYKIASIERRIESLNLTTKQKEILNKLDEKALAQFKRLSEGRCSCSVSKDI